MSLDFLNNAVVTSTATRASAPLQETEIANIVFDIEQRPLYLANDLPNNMGADYSPIEHQAIVKRDNQEVLYVGKEYNPMHNVQVIEALQPLLDRGWEFASIRSYNDRKFYINLRHGSFQKMTNLLDVQPRLQIRNSYDGSLALSIRAGIYVLVCSNGAVVGKDYSIRHKHTKSLVDVSTELITEIVGKGLEVATKKEWSANGEAERTWKSLVKPFSPQSMLFNLLKEKVSLNYAKYPESTEFALFMAATDIATHGLKQGVSSSDVLAMEEQVSKVFFN